MKPGRGHAKGAAFERLICQRLSLWVSRNVSHDLFWRSAMSGGRATVGRKKGVHLSRQAGDICAVAPEGHVLTDQFYIETKFYKNLRIERFMIGSGPLFDFWVDTCAHATHYGRTPMLIAKQNQYPILVLTAPKALDKVMQTSGMNVIHMERNGVVSEIREFVDVVSRRFRRV